MVLKIEKPDNNFEKLENDDSFTTVLERINKGQYTAPQFDIDANGKRKFMGLCKSVFYSETNIVPETPSIRQLQFLLFKHGYDDAFFRIFISNNSRPPYVAIVSNKEQTYPPLTYDQLTDLERRIYEQYLETQIDPNISRSRQKPLGLKMQ